MSEEKKIPSLPMREAAMAQCRATIQSCLAAEIEADLQLLIAEREMWRFRDEATSLSDDDSAVEAFAIWLPEGRRRIAGAQMQVDRASAEMLCARAALAYAQHAVDSARALYDRQAG